jgi:hypothetical protein
VSVRLQNVSPIAAGLALGVGAALVQAYFKVGPPEAYGVCMVCHPKDLVNWVANHTLHTAWEVSSASIAWPVLTVLGVVMGAVVAAGQHGELRLRAARRPLFYAVCGFAMVNFALVLGSCPIRIVLLSAYGSPIGLAAWIAIAVGAVITTLVVRWQARRQVERMEAIA